MIKRRLMACTFAAVAALAATAAHAGGVQWHIGINLPGVMVPAPVVVQPPVVYAPPPVYVAPQPVYVAPQPVYVAPQPRVVYGPPPGWYGRPGYHRHHEREYWRERREARWQDGRYPPQVAWGRYGDDD